MVRRFVKYSLERECRICTVLLCGGQMKKTNLQVTAVDDDGVGFTARLGSKKKEIHLSYEDVLTAAYARGDRGELE